MQVHCLPCISMTAMVLLLSAQYETTLIGNSSTKWIEDVVTEDPDRPFFAYLAPHAPHGQAIPAPWYKGHFVGKVEAPMQVHIAALDLY